MREQKYLEDLEAAIVDIQGFAERLGFSETKNSLDLMLELIRWILED